jgi:DNA-binding MarR family transcriptional regulator
MEPKQVKTLFLLEAIDKDDCQSQRELSKKLKISLGLVNSFIKKLSIQGLFKVVHLPKGKVRYILTEKGVSERAKLSNLYTLYLVEFYKETKNRLLLKFDKLYEDGILKIILYGANDLSEIACLLPHKPYQEVVAIIDNKKKGQKVNGVQIYSNSELGKFSYDAILLTESESSMRTKELLIDMKVPAEKIVNLLNH